MRDIEAGHIDCVVVYKVDRLSRSLMDFTRLVQVFETSDVSFVSVTQQFNTTTSMGRLTLNMLLSFAQFEREVTGERIRDKIAASREKGMWMGGHPPLGYDVRDRKLRINRTEARLVRHIFERFVEIGSATKLVAELDAEGHRTKSWTTTAGKTRNGRAFHKGDLYRLLNNRVYLGEAVHKGKSYPGEHKAIIEPELWTKVRAILAENPRTRGNRSRAKTPAPLKGLLRCGHCGRAMTPTHTRKKDRLYRYYVCMTAARRRHDDCPIGLVAAGEIETAVLDQLRGIFRAPEIVARTWRTAMAESGERITASEVAGALNALDPLWESLFPAEQARLLGLLVERVTVSTDGIDIKLRPTGLRDIVAELGSTGPPTAHEGSEAA